MGRRRAPSLSRRGHRCALAQVASRKNQHARPLPHDGPPAFEYTLAAVALDLPPGSRAYVGCALPGATLQYEPRSIRIIRGQTAVLAPTARACAGGCAHRIDRDRNRARGYSAAFMAGLSAQLPLPATRRPGWPDAELGFADFPGYNRIHVVRDPGWPVPLRRL